MIVVTLHSATVFTLSNSFGSKQNLPSSSVAYISLHPFVYFLSHFVFPLDSMLNPPHPSTEYYFMMNDVISRSEMENDILQAKDRGCERMIFSKSNWYKSQ